MNYFLNGRSAGKHMKLTFIYNPGAGTDERPSADELLRLVQAAGHEAVLRLATDDGWKSAVEQPADIVVVAGGDGTVGKVAKSLVGKGIPIAVLPLGTANNIAKTLGLSDKPLQQLIFGWAAARRIKFDVGVANGPWRSKFFIEGLGIGLFTETMYRLDATSNADLAHLDGTDAKITSVMEILKKRLQSPPVKKLKATLDGRDVSGEYILLEVMNTSYIGPNLCLAPHADPCDGLLDIVFVVRGEEDKLNKCLSDCIEGKLTPPTLTVRRGKHLQVQWERFAVHIDDEVWPDSVETAPRLSSPIDVTIKTHALEFLAPA
jgi:diacylglycerol kinase family enzyme